MNLALRFRNFTAYLIQEYGPEADPETDYSREDEQVLEAYTRKCHRPTIDEQGAALFMFHDGSAMLTDRLNRIRFVGTPGDLEDTDEETFALFRKLLDIAKAQSS